MGTDFNIKPIGAPAEAPAAKPQPDAAKYAVQTELPTSKTTTALEASIGGRNNSQNQNERVSERIAIDRAAAEIVYRVVDNRTSMVIKEFPDEMRLRLRAYQRSLDAAKAKSKSNGGDREKVDHKT